MRLKAFILLSLVSLNASAFDLNYILKRQLGACLVGSLILNNVKISPEDGNQKAIGLGCLIGVGTVGYYDHDTRDKLKLPNDLTLREMEKMRKSLEEAERKRRAPVKKQELRYNVIRD